MLGRLRFPIDRKSSPRSCGWWLIYNPTIPFPQTKRYKPLLFYGYFHGEFYDELHSKFHQVKPSRMRHGTHFIPNHLHYLRISLLRNNSHLNYSYGSLFCGTDFQWLASSIITNLTISYLGLSSTQILYFEWLLGLAQHKHYLKKKQQNNIQTWDIFTKSHIERKLEYCLYLVWNSLVLSFQVR